MITLQIEDSNFAIVVAGGQEHLLASGALDPESGRVRVHVLDAEEQKAANRVAAVDRATSVRCISVGQRVGEGKNVRECWRVSESVLGR